MASSTDAWYLALLGLAENFRTSTPPNIRLCIQCLQAVFTFKPPPKVEARTYLQLGNILLTHTKNIQIARQNLEQAWTLSQSLAGFDDVKFEAASLLAGLYEQQGQIDYAKPILRKAIEISQQAIYWHCRLLFQLAQIHMKERDYQSALGLLEVGVEYANFSGAGYTRILFMLSKAMLLIIERRPDEEVRGLLGQAGVLVENWSGNAPQKEYLRVFYLILQVCHYLLRGHVKSLKPYLKQLHQSIQTMSQPEWLADEAELLGSNAGDNFMWLPRDHLCVLVYLVTVAHHMQAGYMDKAQKYAEKGLMQVEKLKILDTRPILTTFHVMLLEHLVMCRLVMGHKALAIQETHTMAQQLLSHPAIANNHMPQLHTILGLYAMGMNCMEDAEAQFVIALRTSRNQELWTFVNLNLGIVYLRGKREHEFLALQSRIDPEQLPSMSDSLRAAAYYVQGLRAFFANHHQEAKRFLRETLKMANTEDFNRLMSISLVLLGHIFLAQGNSQESLNMVTPAMHLASKIPDDHVQLWASAILKDLYTVCQNPNRAMEASQMMSSFSSKLLQDHIDASKLPEHSLIKWTDGPFPLSSVAHVPPPSNPLI